MDFYFNSVPQHEASSLKNLENRGVFNSNNFAGDDEIKRMTFYIVGAGGTGGYFIRDFARFIYSFYERRIDKGDRDKIRIIVIDGDDVEEKNLLRQNFIPSDLGKNKAEVMTARYNKAFGIGMEYIPQFFNKELYDDLKRSETDYGTCDVFIGCVDNNEARRSIDAEMNRGERRSSHAIRKFWIDAGNQRKSGQVILGGRRKASYYGDDFKIPTVADLYPEILDASADEEVVVSCAERMMEDEQNMFINIMAASNLLLLTKKIFLSEPMNIHGMDFSLEGGVSTYHLVIPETEE